MINRYDNPVAHSLPFSFTYFPMHVGREYQRASPGVPPSLKTELKISDEKGKRLPKIALFCRVQRKKDAEPENTKAPVFTGAFAS